MFVDRLEKARNQISAKKKLLLNPQKFVYLKNKLIELFYYFEYEIKVTNIYNYLFLVKILGYTWKSVDTDTGSVFRFTWRFVSDQEWLHAFTG